MSELAGRRSSLAKIPHSVQGFTFVEVLVAMAVTTIVLAAVFGLLSRWIDTTRSETQRSDLQAQARHALERMSEDIMLAGTDLPLEFPAFTPLGVNPNLDGPDDGPDAVEIIGHFNQDASGREPLRVLDFDGHTVLLDPLDKVPTGIKRGQLVLIYDDKQIDGAWMFGIVHSVESYPQPALKLVTEPGAAVDDLRLPPFIVKYNRSRPSSGYATPVTVVTYMVEADTTTPEQERVLWRQVNWGAPVQVAFVEDLQIRFFIGGTVSELVAYARPGVPPRTSKSQETELEHPPIPQPDPSLSLQPGNLVRGVRVFVTSRSREANLVGGTDEEGHVRSTFSTRVSPRNILYKLSARQNQKGFNP